MHGVPNNQSNMIAGVLPRNEVLGEDDIHENDLNHGVQGEMAQMQIGRNTMMHETEGTPRTITQSSFEDVIEELKQELKEIKAELTNEHCKIKNAVDREGFSLKITGNDDGLFSKYKDYYDQMESFDADNLEHRRYDSIRHLYRAI